MLGIDRLMLGLAPVTGVQRARRPQAERAPVVSPQIGQPVPGTQTGGGPDALTTGGRKGLAQRRWGRGHGAVEHCGTGVGEDAHGHGAGMQSDPTVQRGRCRGASP